MQYISTYWREILAWLAVIIAMYSYITYIRSIFVWKTEPHMFSWGIWALTTWIAFFAQLAWWGWWWSAQNWVTFVVCLFVMVLAIRYGKRNTLTKLDWSSLVVAFAAIWLWFYTDNAFYGSLLATVADLIGYIPTISKVWKKPESEPKWYFLLMNIKHTFSLIALSSYSWTTMMYSASVVIINFGLIAIQIIK